MKTVLIATLLVMSGVVFGIHEVQREYKEVDKRMFQCLNGGQRYWHCYSTMEWQGLPLARMLEGR